MASGLTAAGFIERTILEIKADIEEDLRRKIGAGLDVGPDTILGQFVGVTADRLAELWQLALAVYRSQYPDSASGDALDQVCALTGVLRLDPTKSTVTLTCSGTPGTVLPAGRVVSVVGTGLRFVSTVEATIGGAGTVDVGFAAEETGPKAAPAGTLTVIETPVGGWDSVTNALDAVLGRDAEPDDELRTRREDQLRATGSGTVDAIRADVLAVGGVTAAFVFENVTSVTDGDGVPGKAFEVVVRGGVDQDIADTIWGSKPAGIESHGTTVVGVTDAQGFAHNVEFSRPVEQPIYIELSVETDGNFPVDGVAQIKAALVEHGDALTIGDDVIASRFAAIPFEVPGVVDVPVFKIDTVTPAVNEANIAVGTRQLATFDTGRIVVTLI